jgi:protein-L-isoaspartate(D-aspartate) O-methyltransferase
MIFTPVGYIETPTDDPRFLYQDVVVSLDSKGPLNNGEPTLHAACLSALELKPGETVLHVGAGTGYYTTLLAKLVGEEGEVHAYEVDGSLAHRATANLAEFPYVTVHYGSGVKGPFAPTDVIYVNAGATTPMAAWLDALKAGGRLLFPLTPSEGPGAMLLITKEQQVAYAARFLFQAQFVHCIGARDEAEGRRLTEAFRNENWSRVKWLHRSHTPGDGCWCFGAGWWLSTKSPREES